jgi:hypothetical protein
MIQRNKFKLAGLGAIVVLFFLVQTSFGQQTINWNTQADSPRGRNGQQVTYVFPGQESLSSRRMNGGGQWGYDISEPPRGGDLAASGYWKYDSQSFRPTNEYYATIKPMPGHVYETRVTGGLQAGPGDAKGSIEQFFKTDNADLVVFLTTSTLTFGANANLVTLVPLQKVVFELGLVFNANDAARALKEGGGAYGTGSIAIDNGENIVNVTAKLGQTASGKGEATIPGGGPGATMFIHVGSGLSQLGAMHTTLDIGYVWVAGTTPPLTPPAGNERVLFDSMNGYGVGNGPTAPATFTIGQPHVLTSITTYHWNDGRGTRAGTIGLRDAAGRGFGPWGVAGSPGQGGVPNAFWTATPNVTMPAGEYTIIDSEPSTWSQNSQSGNRGFSTVKSYPTSAVPSTKPPVNPINIGEDRLGREWSETENDFIGRWVRRGNSKIWDASWNNGAVAELSISIAGDKVTINRRDVAGPSIGLTSIYEGTLAPDGTMHGTETVTFAGNPTSSRFDWRARIVAP